MSKMIVERNGKSWDKPRGGVNEVSRVDSTIREQEELGELDEQVDV